MMSCRLPTEESKIFSPAQHLVGCSGQVLYKKLKPLRRSRADKIQEKALEQEYLDKVRLPHFQLFCSCKYINFPQYEN